MQPTNRPVNAVELRDVTKTFGKVVANDHVSLDIRKGEILSLLGERLDPALKDVVRELKTI